ncbi:MAG TPA: polysaccharide deacetylase family protein [Anaerolineales bacterium]|nr:polysaccharide deacetylase family protein [Anaerolineales bacterium]
MIKKRLFPTLILLAILLAGCQPAAPTADSVAIQTAAFETALAQISIPTQTPAPTDTAIPTATVPRTPPALPSIYQSPILKPEDLPRTYVADTCTYLQSKWNPNNAAPGTVVMPIMIHAIDQDANSSQLLKISGKDFRQMMNDLHEFGFQAINMQQMADFMYNNARIPQRSVLLIVDDRAYAEKFNTHFRGYFEDWGWPVVNAYIGLDERPDLWAENAALSAEGWVDYQSHGYIHNVPITDSSTDEYITAELSGAITSIQKYMNKTPIAYIWPGGGFSRRAVELAPQLGYQLGFTVNPRGPVMYNWVPQADAFNASNPYAIPEVPAGNPLMTLPRYADINARSELDNVRQISEQAAAYAEQNRATELEYYDIMCAPTYGPIPPAQ